MAAKPVTLRKTAHGYESSDGRWDVEAHYYGARFTEYVVTDTLGLITNTPVRVSLADVRAWIKRQDPLPPNVDVHRINEGYYKIHTPQGTYTLERTAYLAGEAGTSGYGTAPHWYLINPGESRPDSKGDTMGGMVDYVRDQLAWELDPKGGKHTVAELAAESWRLEHHDDNSTWGPLAKAYFDRARAARTGA